MPSANDVIDAAETEREFRSLPEASEQSQFLIPDLWREVLEKFARATRLAVMLSDAQGHPLHDCLQPKTLWRLFRRHAAPAENQCPLSILSSRPCSCAADACAAGRAVMVKDRIGLVHFAVPLTLEGKPFAALIAGQVFDQYPDQELLAQAARRVGLSPAVAWEKARLELPVKQATLNVYADLLQSLGQTFLQTRYDLAVHSRTAQAIRKLNTELEHRVEERTKELNSRLVDVNALERQVAEIAAGERRRISQDLHDSTGQVLTGLGLMASSLSAALEEKSLVEAKTAKKIGAGIKDVLGQIRAIIKGLAPVDIDSAGLMAALTDLALRTTQISGIPCSFACQETVLFADNQVATDLYHIAQEAVTNALKHGRPKNIAIALKEMDSQVILEIEDDGRGMREANAMQKGSGMRIMRYRAERNHAELEIAAGERKGVRITCRLAKGNS